MARFVVVGNPENRRVDFFRAAAGEAGAEVEAVSYLELFEAPERLRERLAPGTILRIESPGENFEVERGLLRAGIDDVEAEGLPVLSERRIDALSFDRGLILYPRQAYLGYRSVLASIGAMLHEAHAVGVMNDPGEIAEMFDKPTTHARCAAAGLPVPRSLGVVRGYEDLRARMAAGWPGDSRPISRLFVKPANGSSASGVIALHVGDEFTRAVTSVELVRTNGESRLYNSLRVRTYTDEREVAELVDALTPHVLHTEEWLPKANPTGRGNIDLRVVVIGGRATHVVARRSRGPITNLHLGNRREDLEAVRARVPEDRWTTILTDCERAAAVFPRSLYAGVDLLPLPGFRRHAIAEVNAFGDLLPGILHDGRNTYATEVAAVLASQP